MSAIDFTPEIIYPTEPAESSPVGFNLGLNIPHSRTWNSLPVDQILILSPFLIVPSKTLT